MLRCELFCLHREKKKEKEREELWKQLEKLELERRKFLGLPPTGSLKPGTDSTGNSTSKSMDTTKSTPAPGAGGGSKNPKS